MTTSMRGRSSSSRSNVARQTGWGAWGRSTSSYKKAGGKSRKTGASVSSSLYRTVGTTLAKKIDSFKMLYAQTQGAGKYGRPSPTVLNSLATWIGKGAIIQTVSLSQVARWARANNLRFNSHSPSATACKNVLCAKFSRTLIKAVALTKNGQFMVATLPTRNGKAFSFPR